MPSLAEIFNQPSTPGMFGSNAGGAAFGNPMMQMEAERKRMMMQQWLEYLKSQKPMLPTLTSGVSG